MRVLAPGLCGGFLLCVMMAGPEIAKGQQGNAPPPHVFIPNPTPRQPDLEKVYGDDARADKKKKELSVQSQLRAREIWLESNQILLLAQQLQQEVFSDKKSAAKTSSAAKVAKVAKIEKLAQSVQEQMKTQ